MVLYSSVYTWFELQPQEEWRWRWGCRWHHMWRNETTSEVVGPVETGLSEHFRFVGRENRGTLHRISLSGWWFGCHFLFSHQYWVYVIIPIDELHHSSEGWRKTTNQVFLNARLWPRRFTMFKGVADSPAILDAMPGFAATKITPSLLGKSRTSLVLADSSQSVKGL